MSSASRFSSATGMACGKILAVIVVGVTCWSMYDVLLTAPVSENPFDRLTARCSGSVIRIQAAGELAAQGAAAVPQLLQALSHADPLVRRAASYAIGQIGDDAAEAESGLYERLTDAEPLVRAAALSALSKTCQDPTRLARRAVLMFSDDNQRVRYSAHKTLTRLGRSALPQLCRAAGHRDVVVRRCVAQTLLATRIKTCQTTESAQRLLRDEDGTVRTYALHALTVTKAVTHADLVQALGDQNPAILLSALQQPRSVFRPTNRELAAKLVKLLEYPARNIRLLAALRLRAAPVAARRAIPVLIRLLDSVNGASKVVVAETLAEIGAPRDSFVPALLKLVFDTSDRDSAWYSASVLATYARKEVAAIIPEIVKRLERGDYSMRVAAVSALMGFGSAARDAVPSLIQLLDSNHAEIRTKAAYALAIMGKSARQAISTLIERVRAEATETQFMELAGRESAKSPAGDQFAEESFFPFLMQQSRWRVTCLWNQNRCDHSLMAAIEALGRHGNRNSAALDSVLVAVNDQSPTVRAAVAIAIKHINCEADRSSVALRRLIADKNPAVRDAAARAIGHLGLLSVIHGLNIEDADESTRLYRVASRASRHSVSMRRRHKTNRPPRRRNG